MNLWPTTVFLMDTCFRSLARSVEHTEAVVSLNHGDHMRNYQSSFKLQTERRDSSTQHPSTIIALLEHWLMNVNFEEKNQ